MTQDEILSTAKEAGLRTGGNGYYAVCHQTDLEAFAKIIERKTIERCAVVCEEFSNSPYDERMIAGIHLAAAIRKLGEE